MKKLLVAALLLATCGAFAEGSAGTAPADAKEAAEPFKLIHVADLAAWMADTSQKTYIFDANNAKTRKSEGSIPGAKLLPSSDKYVVASTLPKEKDSNLVFYCANEACTASHMAAKRAIDAGYTKVSVLADGIKGWRAAGKPTTKTRKS